MEDTDGTSSGNYRSAALALSMDSFHHLFLPCSDDGPNQTAQLARELGPGLGHMFQAGATGSGEPIVFPGMARLCLHPFRSQQSLVLEAAQDRIDGALGQSQL